LNFESLRRFTVLRKIVKIVAEKCTGCGLCAEVCHEGAIGIIEGKARLLRDDYCDGLGNCLPVCPEGAIRLEECEAKAFDKEAVKKSRVEGQAHSAVLEEGGLSHWPIQIKLAPVNAPYFANADLLVSADCCAYAYCAFHDDFIQGRIVLIGCPKLDAVDYSDKLFQIITQNHIKSFTVVKMEVPCCGGIEYAASVALQKSNKTIPCEVITVSVRGEILSRLPDFLR
jgi:ferredoxin